MELFEIVVMGSILVLCGAGIAWLLVDMHKQLKAYEKQEENK